MKCCASLKIIMIVLEMYKLKTEIIEESAATSGEAQLLSNNEDLSESSDEKTEDQIQDQVNET